MIKGPSAKASVNDDGAVRTEGDVVAFVNGHRAVVRHQGKCSSAHSISKVGFFRHNIDGAWYFARATHFTALLAFFVIFILLSIVLELRPSFLFSQAEDTLSMYLSEFFLIVLPLLLFIVYFLTFKVLLVRSKMQ